MTIGGRQPLNRFSDKIRAEVHLFVVFHSSSIICSSIGPYCENISGQVARAGYMEVLTFILSSHEENFDMLNRTDDKSKAVIIANPRTSEFEVTPAECSHHLALLFFLKKTGSPVCSQFPIFEELCNVWLINASFVAKHKKQVNS